jgi:hypothetical protein
VTKYYSGDQIENEMDGTCKTHGGGAYRFMVRTPEGKRPPGKSRHMWENNIKMELQEVG